MEDDLDFEDTIITMKDDETGENIEFMIMDTIEADNYKYFLVIETEDIDNENAEALLLKETSLTDENIIYSIVDDDDELNKIVDLLKNSSDDYSIEL